MRADDDMLSMVIIIIIFITIIMFIIIIMMMVMRRMTMMEIMMLEAPICEHVLQILDMTIPFEALRYSVCCRAHCKITRLRLRPERSETTPFA